MRLGLEKCVVLVTGGSAGIGRAIVRSFLDEGTTVVYCSRTTSGKEFDNSNAFGTQVDITDKEALEKWIAEVVQVHGGIDVVVSNVSVIAISDTLESWQKTYETDMLAAVNLIKATIPHLSASKRSPNIITISSVSGIEIDVTAPGPYGPFKAALIHYSQSLARHLAPQGIRVNVVSPGNIYIEDGFWGNMERSQPEFFDQALKLNPTGRMGTDKEIADAVVFLASPLSGFTTGTNLVIDGGLSTGVHI